MIKIAGYDEQSCIETYRSRIHIPDEMQPEMRSWVREAETELNEFNAPDQYNGRAIEDFCSLVKRFLHCFTYTQNLLSQPYTPSEKTIGQVRTFRREFCFVGSVKTNPEYWAGTNNKTIYYLEKAMRVVADEPLSDDISSDIIEGEDFLFGEGNYFTLIKILGRHKGLDLPLDFITERRRVLQEFVHENAGRPCVYDNESRGDGIGFLCSAQRAVFDLPQIDRNLIDSLIHNKIENSDADLDDYISALHHLYELLSK